MSSVWVVITVPIEEEERRLNTSRCSCGRLFMRRSASGTGDELHAHWPSQSDMCERCCRRRQSQLDELEPNPAQVEGSREAEGQERARCGRNRTLELGLADGAPLEKVLRCIEKQLLLEDVFWSKDFDGRKLQARFGMLLDERYECLICTLQEWGIGERHGTTVNVMNCLDCLDTRTNVQPQDGRGRGRGVESTWESFMDSVRCRLNVNQVVRQVSRDANLTFDFVVLLIAAALLSCVGLVEDNVLFMSSSMLISPLMGPIIAGVFGTVIGDRNLCWLGMKNEIFGVAIAALIGFLFGGVVCAIGHFFAISGGLTGEILSRCDTHSLAVGVFTALASGAAGAIGILGGNTGSLVGVAISASLLPPAVNSGLLWALSLGTRLMEPDTLLFQSLAKHAQYSPSVHLELLTCACISMGLTLLNVVCVWLMGVVVLRIKEVAPAVRSNHQFWRHDVKIARATALHDPALQDAINQLQHKSLRDAFDLNAAQYQHTWSPGQHPTTLTPFEARPVKSTASQDNNNNNYHTVHGFQEFCITLHKLNSVQSQSQTPSQSPLTVMKLFERKSGLKPARPAAETIAPPPDELRKSLSSEEAEVESSACTSYRSLPDLSSAPFWESFRHASRLAPLPPRLGSQYNSLEQVGAAIPRLSRMTRSASLSSDPDCPLSRASRKRSVRWSFPSEEAIPQPAEIPATLDENVSHVSSLDTSLLPSNSPEALKRLKAHSLLPLRMSLPKSTQMPPQMPSQPLPLPGHCLRLYEGRTPNQTEGERTDNDEFDA